jgi:uncharacterized membrane protein
MADKPSDLPLLHRLGSTIAPPRFLLFLGALGAGLGVMIPMLGAARGIMAGFDIASILFLAALAPLLRSKAAEMRDHARVNDANRAWLLALSVLVTLVILVSVASEMSDLGSPFTIALVIATLVLCWLFSNMVWALHYAHLFYVGAEHGGDSGGLDFPETDEPDYWDFIYFSFTLGMTFQTSDVAITATAMRQPAIIQSLAAFIFNIGVLAFSINVLGS